MNDYDTINRNLREHFAPMQKRIRPNTILNTSNTLEHELKKMEIAYKLMEQGREIIIEGKLKNGKRPDIVVLDIKNPIAYEIMKSESDESISKKEESYGMRIIKVRC